MKSTLACVALLITMAGCRIQPSAPTSGEIEDSEKGSAAYLKTLTDDQRQSYKDAKDGYLKGLKDDPVEAKKIYALDVLDSQKTLGSLGYGTLFTGVVDKERRMRCLSTKKTGASFRAAMLTQ